MAYSVPRIACRLASAILLFPPVRISLGLAFAALLYIGGSQMAEKLTAIGYAFIVQGVLCLVSALASIVVRTIPKALCMVVGLGSEVMLLAACGRSQDEELRWLSAAVDSRVAVWLVYYFVAILICTFNLHAHRTMKPKELAAFVGVLLALLSLSPISLAWRIATKLG